MCLKRADTNSQTATHAHSTTAVGLQRLRSEKQGSLSPSPLSADSSGIRMLSPCQSDFGVYTDLGWLSASSTQAELQLGRLRSHSTRGSQRWCPLHTSIHTHPATAAVRAPSRPSSFSSEVVNRSDCVFHHHHHTPLPARPYPLSWTLQRAPVRPRPKAAFDFSAVVRYVECVGLVRRQELSAGARIYICEAGKLRAPGYRLFGLL